MKTDNSTYAFIAALALSVSAFAWSVYVVYQMPVLNVEQPPKHDDTSSRIHIESEGEWKVEPIANWQWRVWLCKHGEHYAGSSPLTYDEAMWWAATHGGKDQSPLKPLKLSTNEAKDYGHGVMNHDSIEPEDPPRVGDVYWFKPFPGTTNHFITDQFVVTKRQGASTYFKRVDWMPEYLIRTPDDFTNMTTSMFLDAMEKVEK